MILVLQIKNTMEVLTIVLASFFGIASTTGVVLDKVLESTIRSKVYSVEQMSVRVDNTPSYKVLNGSVDHVRVAARGIQPIESLRLEAVELETDPISVNIDSLKAGKLVESLRQPLQVALRLEIKESDVNQALAAPKIKAMLQKLVNNLVPQDGDKEFTIQEIKGQFLGNNRFTIAVKLQQSDEAQPLELTLESSFKLVGGHSVQLIEPSGILNGKKLSTRLLKGFADGLNGQLDLRLLEKSGITARVLQFKEEGGTLYLAVFARLAPTTK